MKTGSFKIALFFIMFAALLVGCKRMPLYALYTKVMVELDIEITPHTELDMVVDTELNGELVEKVNGTFPTLMEAIFYDVTSSASGVVTFIGPNGGEINVPAGNHNMMIYSWGTKSTQVENLNNLQEARAFTSDITDLKGSQFKANLYSAKSQEQSRRNTYKFENDPIIYEPDHLYVSREMNVHIPAFIAQDMLHNIKASASTILDLYSLEILQVDGCENIMKAEVFLTGQAKSYYIGKDMMDASSATMFMTLESDLKNNRLYTVFCTFGRLPDSINNVYLDITTLNGNRHQFVYDVTHQFEDRENVHHTLVIEAGINIPDGDNAGGLSPEVDEWDDEIIDVPLG